MNLSTKVEGIDLDTARYLNGLIKLGYFTLSTFEDCFFHGKYYFFKGEKYSAVIVGSSNVSASGLRNNSELNTFIICENNSPQLNPYLSWYNAFRNNCSNITSLSLECFQKHISEQDTPRYRESYGTSTPEKEFIKKVSELPDDEIKHRLSIWLKFKPSKITENITMSPFAGYILLEYESINLFVFESLSPNNAFYCFNASNEKQLVSQISGKTKTQLYKENLLVRRGYHVGKFNFDVYVASLFSVSKVFNGEELELY